jgi:hypothetical protein
MNTECNRIAEQLSAVINGEAWYGDPVRKILTGVSAEQSQAHPLPKAHSIWELVYHVDAWVKFTLGSIQGVPIPAWPAMPKEQDYPPVTDASEKAWQDALNSFFTSHEKFIEGIKLFGDERLQFTVPGRTYNFSRLFDGMAQHAIYHGAQMAILKKTQS